MKPNRRPDKFLAAVLATAVVSPSTQAAPGSLDVTFAGGKVTTAVGAGNDVGKSVAQQLDGKVVVAGFSYSGNDSDFAVARYLPNGQPDPSFGGGNVTTDLGSDNDKACGVVVQNDGRIVVAGYTGSGEGVDFAVVRYNTNGTLDTTFGGTGKVITDMSGSADFGAGVALQIDGKILVTGCAYNGSNDDFAVVRYNLNGTIDTTFGFNGKLTDDFGDTGDYAYCIAVQSDGKIIIAGESLRVDNYDFAVVRYHSSGTSDSSFGNGGRVFTAIGDSDDAAKGVAVQSDGGIVAAGYAYSNDGADFAAVRYTATGALDGGFGSGDGKVTTTIGSGPDTGNGVVVQSDGRIVIAGESWNGSNWDFSLLRYRADGTLDTGFGNSGKVLTPIGTGNDRGLGIALQSDGSILVAGSTVIGNNTDFAVVRYDGDPVAPAVSVSSVTNITATGATLHGFVNPNGNNTTARFQFGRTTSYGSSENVSLSPSNGTAPQSVTGILTGLTPGSLYHFRLTANSNAGTATTSDYTFTTAGVQNTPLESWRLQYFGTTANSGNAANDADPDRDTIPNLLEWACHLNPTLSSTLITTLAANGANLEFTYTRSLAALNSGTSFTVEWSDTPDTGPWQNTGVSQAGSTNDGTVEEVKFTLPAGIAGSRFVRLRVAAP